MLLRENPYFAILCLTTVISGCVAFIAWIRRAEAPATRPFTWLMVAIAAYASAGAMGTASLSTSSTIFWAQMEAVISSVVTTLFFIFTLHFTHRRQWLTAQRRSLVWVMPVFNIALVLTNSWHHQVWTSIEPIANSHALIFRNGPGYIWLAAWFYVYVISGSLLVARKALRLNKIYKQQAMVVIISTLPPVIVGTLYVFELVPPGVSLLPMSFLFTGIVYFTSLFRFRLFDLLPIARDTLIEKITDGVIVLDTSDRIIDINPAAWQFANRTTSATELKAKEVAGLFSRTQCLGEPVIRVLSKWPTLLQHCQKQDNTELLISICQQPPLHIDLRMTILCDHNQRPNGKLLVIRDVTDVYQAQSDLRQTVNIQRRTQLELKKTNDLLDERLRKIESLQFKLKEQAVRDSLTGLFNRRYFEEALSAEFSKAKRAVTPLAIILLDLDNFKHVNDTYGHQAGDRVLEVFSDIMRNHIRTSDIACRYGGEEFILALPGMNLDEANQRANQIRLALKQFGIAYEGNTINVTVTGGVGAIPEWGGSQDGWISMVDKALYKAKRDGRDRIYKMQLDNLPFGSHHPFASPARTSNFIDTVGT
ncbi:MAG: diguanylate cyclase [Cyanobacteria bacterium J06627_28]